MATLSSRAYRCILSNPRISQISMPFCTTNLSSSENLDLDGSNSNLDAPCSEVTKKREVYDVPLENGLDLGIYKAILVGRVGQSPVQKKLKGGTTVTLFSVGTGGIRSYRKPMENEDPKDYANRGTVQWHRVSVYPARLGDLVVKHIVPGAILYVEGNLETKVFSDPITGLVRRVREVAVRRNGLQNPTLTHLSLRLVCNCLRGDRDAEVVSLSPKTLLQLDRYVCEICNQGFQRDQNLQVHRRLHKVPWKQLKRETAAVRKHVR